MKYLIIVVVMILLAACTKDALIPVHLTDGIMSQQTIEAFMNSHPDAKLISEKNIDGISEVEINSYSYFNNSGKLTVYFFKNSLMNINFVPNNQSENFIKKYHTYTGSISNRRLWVGKDFYGEVYLKIIDVQLEKKLIDTY